MWSSLPRIRKYSAPSDPLIVFFQIPTSKFQISANWVQIRGVSQPHTPEFWIFGTPYPKFWMFGSRATLSNSSNILHARGPFPSKLRQRLHKISIISFSLVHGEQTGAIKHNACWSVSLTSQRTGPKEKKRENGNWRWTEHTEVQHTIEMKLSSISRLSACPIMPLLFNSFVPVVPDKKKEKSQENGR